jgi:hypothetical protein
VDRVADSNDANIHDWRDHIHGSPASPALSHISLPSTGSEQDFAHQFDTLGPPSPESLFAFGALSTTISALSLENSNVGHSLLPHDGMIPYNGSSPASSYGFPSPTPSNASSYFSDSFGEDGYYLSANHSYHSNGSAELLPQSPLGANNSSGFLSPYEETFSSGPPPGIPSSSDQLPPYSLLFSSASSSEPLTGVGDPWNDSWNDFLSSTLDWDQIFHPGPESPYLAHARSPSQPEFIEGPSSQAPPCEIEAPDPKVIKPQVASDAAVAVSEKKRKNPPVCTCIICGRGFTRKHSRACKLNSLFPVSCASS